MDGHGESTTNFRQDSPSPNELQRPAIERIELLDFDRVVALAGRLHSNVNSDNGDLS